MNTSCFQLIKTVLDEVYEQIPGSDQQKDDEIRDRLNYLSGKYGNLLQDSFPVNYTDPATRFAYIYRYVTAHANFVYQIIEDSSDLGALFDQEKVTVSCIGGGPGSDLLGIVKHMLDSGKQADLKCYLFDREKAWSDSWSDLDEKLAVNFRVSTNFNPFDVTKPETWKIFNKYLTSDLFTLIYFMSEICMLQSEASSYFVNLLQKARPGALFLYIDNRGMADWFDSLAQDCALEMLMQRSCDLSLRHQWEEQKTDLGEYHSKFESPKLTSSVDIRICRKPDEIPF